jgi:hypothetical protein
MKISYRTHPILGIINGGYDEIRMDKAANAIKLIADLNYVIDKYKNELNKNVIIVSESFTEAAILCSNKMRDAQLFKEMGDELTGVLIYKGISVIYNSKRTIINGQGAWMLNIIEFYADNVLSVFVWDKVCNHLDKSSFYESWKNAAKEIWDFVLTILMFKKYAQVETKYLPAGQKVKGIDCNYVNDTKSNITYLTSKWFTNLVKSDAFKVRGHFRLQPKKKDGEWTKELIWITDFEKTGYTAPARKLNVNQ